MEVTILTAFEEILDYIKGISTNEKRLVLFRGQATDQPLLPSIARSNFENDTTQVEREMLEELKRRSPLLVTNELKNDWEWLVYAQHFGLKTRLLDWTSNPLAAFWFACSQDFAMNMDSVVFMLKAKSEFLVNVLEMPSPFQYERTKILRPSLNNSRIVAQSGWFTCHKYNRDQKKFVPLEENAGITELLTKVIVPHQLKNDILTKLSILGVSNRTMYPDIVGLCHHLNWKFRNELK